ncbi:hypothetical protein D3C75_1222280 [compost metagenome]
MLILYNATGAQQGRFKVFFVILFQPWDLFRAGAAAHFQMVDKNIITQFSQIPLKTGFLRQLLQKLNQVEIRIFLPGRV